MAKPDWEFWRNMPHAKVWELCALSLNICPDSMRHSPNAWMAGPGSGPIFESSSFPSKEIAEKFGNRLRLLSAYIGKPEHFRLRSLVMGSPARCEIYVADFAIWAVREMKLEGLPPEIVEMAQSNLTNTPAALTEAGASNKGTDADEPVPTANWVLRVQAEAAKRWIALQKGGASPTKHSIKDDLVRWCAEEKIKTSTGIAVGADNLYKFALRPWEPPSDH